MAVARLTATAGPAAAMDTQIRFNVSQPFRVGSRVFDAGVITVHSISAFTPKESLLEVWVNGAEQPRGLGALVGVQRADAHLHQPRDQPFLQRASERAGVREAIAIQLVVQVRVRVDM